MAAKEKKKSTKQAKASKKNGLLGGRPKGTVTAKTKAKQEADALFIKEAQKHLPEMVKALTDAAKGLYKTVEKDGQVVSVYRKPPDVSALKEFFDRTIGKASQQIELRADDESAVILSKQAQLLANQFLDEDTTEKTDKVAKSS